MDKQQLSIYNKKNSIKPILIILVFSMIIMLLDIPNGYIKGHDTDFHLPAITAISEHWNENNTMVNIIFIWGNFLLIKHKII